MFVLLEVMTSLEKYLEKKEETWTKKEKEGEENDQPMLAWEQMGTAHRTKPEMKGLFLPDKWGCVSSG